MFITAVLSYNYLPVIVFSVQLFLAELLFCVYLKRRKHFVLKLTIGLILFFGCACLIGAGVSLLENSMGIRTVTILILSVLLFFACFESSFSDVFFRCAGGMFLQNLAANLYDICATAAGHTEYEPVSVWMFLSFIVCYAACWFACARCLKGRENISVNKIFTLCMTLFSYFICDVIFMRANVMTDAFSRIAWQGALGFCDLFSLMLLFGVFGRKVIEEEKYVLEQIIKENARKYELEKSTAEIINMKCHDIKYHLDMLKLYDEDKQSIDEIKRAVSIYDNIAKTGNSALDFILSERALLCEQYQISFEYMVNGKCLEKLAPTDIAVIFGNLLDNAIEYLKSLTETEERNLELRIAERAQGVCIHVENTCVDKLRFINDLPASTKGDDTYHGFGIKSVQYTVHKYGGNLAVHQNEESFIVDIFIPVSAL